MTEFTKKVSTQKAVALAKKIGLTVADLDVLKETPEGMLFKEGDEYFLTTHEEVAEPKAPAVAVFEKIVIGEAKQIAKELSGSLYRAGAKRRVKSRLFKRILKKKTQGRELTTREMDLLYLNASAVRHTAV